ncbi:MAG: TolC family protein, partial [Candidatus Krumholzibacteria bacterium]|nr:TolC family protein [Candidatus Krumholzibacteria bacterium]
MIRNTRGAPPRVAAVALAAALALAQSPPALAARVLSLRECIDIAVAGNPEMGAARQRLRKSESDVMSGYGGLLPDLTVDFYAGHRYYGPSSVQFDERGRPVRSEGFDYEDYTLRIGSNIVIWDGGGNYARLNQAKQSREGARERFAYDSDMLTAAVIRSYYDLVRTRMLSVVAEESVEQARRNLERTEALLEVGSATRADVLKARVRHSNTRLDLIRARNRVELARTDLVALLNMPGEDVDIDTTLAIETVRPDLDGEIEFALKNRSELQSLAHYRESARSGISAARSGWLPTVGASFGYYWSDRSMADNLNFFKEEYQWSVTGFLSLNLFDRFQTGASVKRARADLRIAEYELERYELEAMREVKNLVLMIDEARERIAVATETVEQAGED